MKARRYNLVQRRLLRFGYPQSMVEAVTYGSDYYRMEMGTLAEERKVKKKGVVK